MGYLLKKFLQLVGLRVLAQLVDVTAKFLINFFRSIGRYSTPRTSFEWGLRRTFYGV